MANMFEAPVYADDEKRPTPYRVTEEDRKDPTLAGLTDEEIVNTKTPVSGNMFEQPVFETPEEPEAPPQEEQPGLARRALGYAGTLGYETLKGLGGATNRAAQALNTTVGALPVLWDKAVSVVSGHQDTTAQDAWFRAFVDPTISNEEAFAPGEDFGSKAANAMGSTLGTISQLVLTGGESATAGAANEATGTVVRGAVEHGVKAMTVPAISESVNTGREVYQKTNDASKAVAAAQAKYLTTAASGIIPLSAPGGVGMRALTGAVSGAATGELDRTTQSALVPETARDFSGEETALNAMTGAVMGVAIGPRGAPRPKKAGPLDAIDEGQQRAAEEAKAKGGDALDQVLAAARAGSELSETMAGAHYEHANQIERLRMADEAAAAAQAEAESTAAEQAAQQKAMAEEAERQAATSDDQAAVRAPRTADEPVYQPPTGRKLAYERGFDRAEAERAAKAPQEAAAKAKDYDEALVQRERQTAEKPALEPAEPLATLADVAPKNLFEKPVHAPEPVKPANLREARRLKRLEAEKAAAEAPVEQKLLPGPETTGRILVDKEGTARPETGADVRERTAKEPTNLTLRREQVNREPLALKEVNPREATLKRANGEYAKQLVAEEARHTVERKGPEKEGTTPPDVVAEANRRAAEEARKELDRMAHEAATSPENDLPAPTEAQDRAGNFKMGHAEVHGMDVSVEYPRGSKRPYTTREGVKGEREMPDHYGYFKGTEGADGQHVDVLIGEHPESEKSYVVDHLDTDGNFEQHKVLSGYRSQLEAVRAYKKVYPERKVGPIKEMNPRELKDWLKNGDTKKPLQPEKLGRAADRSEKTQARGSKLRYREGDLTVHENPPDNGRGYFISVEGPNGKEGGHVQAPQRGDALQVSDSFLGKGLRGKGFAVKAYETVISKAKEKGLRFVSDTVVSDDAHRVYDALKKRGYDVRKNPTAELDPETGNWRSTDTRPVFEVTPKQDDALRYSRAEWFKGSKVADAEGKPLRVYHGTSRDFADFSKSKQGAAWENDDGAFPRDGFWFSEDPNDASFYAKKSARELGGAPNVRPVHLALKNPYEVTAERFADEGEAAIPTQSELEQQGYDGIIVNRAEWTPEAFKDRSVKPRLIKRHFVAFRPDQIRSAVGNIRERMADASVSRAEPRGTDALNEREIHRTSVRKALDAFNKELPGAEVQAHDSVDDAPQAIRARMEADDQLGARAVYDPDTDTVHVFADNHASPEDAVVTAVHEAVAHKGLRHLLKEGFETTMHDVFDNAADKSWIKDFMAQHGLDSKDASHRVIAAEEYAASIAERMDADPTVWRKVVDTVRSALRKLGLVKKWTENDIQALLRKSRSGLREAVPRLRESDNNRLRYAGDSRPPPGLDDDHPLSVAFKAGATAEEQANYNPGFVRSRVDALKAFGQNNLDKLLGAMPRDKLRDFVAPGKMPSLDAYTREVQKMDGRRNELQVESEKIAKRWLKYNRKNRENGKTLAELMHAATLAGVEPSNEYRPLHENPKGEQVEIERQRKVQHTRLRKFWNSLDGEGKALYIDVRDAYAKDRDRIMQALEQRINGAEAEGRTKVQLLAELRQQFEKGRVAGPYFPLARFGKHWAVARDAVGEVASFVRFEKPSERDAWREEMEKQGFKTDGGQKFSDDMAMAKALDPNFVSKITDLLNQVDKDLADDVWQHYLRTLPELSMRKHFIHRKGRLGFTGDALRAFAYNKFHASHQIAKLEHMAKLEGHLEQMAVEARNLEETKDKEAKWAVPIMEEFRQRHEWARNPKLSSLSRTLTSLGYGYYMAASPATAFVNLTQTAAVALPVLSGEFHSVSATGELMKATAQWAGSRGDFGNRLRGDERKAFDEAAGRGIYEKTQAHDLASIGNEGADFGSVRQQTMEVASFLFHHIERFNREATHIASYRLARKRGMNHDAASELAIRLTNDAHFDYSNANRPRYMQGNAARVLLLFRNYAVNMTYRLARDFRNGVIRVGKTPEERHGAFTRFAGMLGATMLQAGVTGMPMWFAAKKVLNLIFGDEDTPFDAEAALYAHLTHQYGERVATTIMHGAIDANTPVTLSSRVGLNNMWLHDPPPNLEGRDEGLFYLQEVAGPVGGLVVKAAQAAAPAPGQADKALELVAPKAAGDVLKAIRYAREGVTDAQGRTVIPPEEITKADLFAQAVGFSPEHITRVQEQNRNIKAAVNKIGDRRQELVDRLFLAAHADDAQGVKEAYEKIAAFNAKNPRVAIKAGNIISSAKARNRYSQQAIDGLRVDPSMRYLQEELRITDRENK